MIAIYLAVPIIGMVNSILRRLRRSVPQPDTVAAGGGYLFCIVIRYIDAIISIMDIILIYIQLLHRACQQQLRRRYKILHADACLHGRRSGAYIAIPTWVGPDGIVRYLT